MSDVVDQVMTFLQCMFRIVCIARRNSLFKDNNLIIRDENLQILFNRSSISGKLN